MNRMFRIAVLFLAVAGGLGSIGCCAERPGLQDRMSNWADPCWPERYSYAARSVTLAPFAAHVNNGVILDHTVFEWMFEQGTDNLLPAGQKKLDYIVRRRPAPNAMVYLQTSRDVPYDQAAPEKLVSARQDLDTKRAEAVHKYLMATSAGRSLAFQVQVIDMPDSTMSVQAPANAVRGYPGRFTAGVTGAVGSGAVVGAGGGLAPGAPGSGMSSSGGSMSSPNAGGGGAAGGIQ